MEEEEYNPYCEKCSGCGESGCCDALNCAYKNMQDCQYGETYFKDIECEVKSFRDIYEYIFNLSGNETVNEIKEHVERIYDIYLDKIFYKDK